MNEWSRLTLVTAPTTYPVTLDEVKAQLRITWTDEDDYLNGLISAATATLDGPHGIGIALMPQTWRLSLDGFPFWYAQIGGDQSRLQPGYGGGDIAYPLRQAIRIPLAPVTAVNSIKYTDDGGVTQTVDKSDYVVDLDATPARLTPPWGESWPIAWWRAGGVKIEFDAGYETLPADLKHAVLLMVAHWYQSREAVLVNDSRAVALEIPFGVQSIISRYQIGYVA